MTETILCIPEESIKYIFKDHPRFVFTLDSTLFKELLTENNFCLLPRPLAEKNPAFKQVIPYTLLKYNGKYATYRRNKKGGENRLHSKYSIGFGGHINVEDMVVRSGMARAEGYNMLYNGRQREMLEEVSLVLKEKRPLGLLYDPSEDVGQVHLGFVEIWHLDHPSIKMLEDCNEFNGYKSPQEILEFSKLIPDSDGFENWSMIIAEFLYSIDSKITKTPIVLPQKNLTILDNNLTKEIIQNAKSF